MRKLLCIFLGSLSISSMFAADIPGGLLRNSEGLETHTYEMVLSPSYLLSQGGAYLTSELRYQAGEDIGVAFGFGAGEVGFNFGANATWFIVPDLETQPAVAVLGGIYLSRVIPDNYVVFKVAPMLSKTYKMEWGKLTPYAGLEFFPSVRLGTSVNELSMKSSMGVEFILKSMNGLKLRSEVGVAVLQSFNEMAFSISYPFKAL